jgi:CheY-like chemotaxis protein
MAPVTQVFSSPGRTVAAYSSSRSKRHDSLSRAAIDLVPMPGRRASRQAHDVIGAKRKTRAPGPAELSLSRSQEEDAGTPRLADLTPPGANIILLVQSDHVRELLALALRRRGHTVYAMRAAPGVLRMLKARPEIDLLVADMPRYFERGVDRREIRGVALAEAAKSLRPSLEMLFTLGLSRQLRGLAAVRTPAQILDGLEATSQTLTIVESLLTHHLDAG